MKNTKGLKLDLILKVILREALMAMVQMSLELKPEKQVVLLYMARGHFP